MSEVSAVSTRRPHILYLCSCWPHDRAFGGQLRCLNIARALHELGEITITVVSSDLADEDVVRRTAAEFQVAPPVRVRLSRNGLTPRLRRAFDARFLDVHGCVAESADRARALEHLGEFDLIWLSNSRTPNIMAQWSWPRSVLDIDDLPSMYERTIWQNGSGLREKLTAGARMLLLKRREALWKDRFDALAVCSEADRQSLGGGKRIHVIPNGFERPSREPLREPAFPPRIGFIGLFSYSPNLQGVRWFLEQCWDRIKAQVPEARLRLVGKDTDGSLRPAVQDVDALGWLPDTTAEIATWSAMIIPVRHGAGTRVKIADAFSRKCPVVSTRLGAFGYEARHGGELLLADSPAEFAAACVSLIKDPAAAAAMAERAYAAFLRNWTWDAIAPRARAAAEDALRKSH